jgi:hypothetical protein
MDWNAPGGPPIFCLCSASSRIVGETLCACRVPTDPQPDHLQRDRGARGPRVSKHLKRLICVLTKPITHALPH